MSGMGYKTSPVEQAIIILEQKIQELGPTSEGWAVDILLHAIGHLGRFITCFDGYSAVERWYHKVPRRLPDKN